MRTLLIILVLKATLFIGQQSDSSLYHVYKKKKNVTSVKYVKEYYSNGQLKAEGWEIIEKPSTESEILQVKDLTNCDSVGHKFGIWKYYYKDGMIRQIDSIGTSYDEIVKEYYYSGLTSNNKDCLLKIVIFKPSVSVDKLAKAYSSTKKQDDVEWIYFQYFRLFNCNVLKKEEHFVKKGIKTGTWKWYRNGKLTKTKDYKDGRLMVKKYGA